MKEYRKRIADDILKRKLEGKGAVLIADPLINGLIEREYTKNRKAMRRVHTYQLTAHIENSSVSLMTMIQDGHTTIHMMDGGDMIRSLSSIMRAHRSYVITY